MAGSSVVERMDSVGWRQGWWLNRPPSAGIEQGRLKVRAAQGSDAWRTTSYGFVRDSPHALLTDLPDEMAVEVSFLADFDQLFDQAGVLVRVDEQNWIKAGIEFSDGSLQASAVVTRGVSDWSISPVPDWAGREVTVRASRSGTALTVRIRPADQPWQLLRLAPIDPWAAVYAGPYCCAPQRAGLTVTFTRWQVGQPDPTLHAD
jgi:uncharacterized protein